MFGIDEVEFGRGEGQRLPVESTFEEERTTCILGALEAFLEFVLEAVELLGRQAAFAGGIDECAGWPCGVIEESLVPFGGLIVNVDCGGGGFDGGETVMFVEWVEKAEVKNGAHGRETAVSEGNLSTCDEG